MKYKVVEDDEIFDDIDAVINYCVTDDYHEDDDYFKDWVNESEPSVTINGCTYEPYDIVDALDEENYRDLQGSFIESMNEADADQAYFELEHARNGDEVIIQAYTVLVFEEEETEENEDDLMKMFEG